jgi:hypothetical protein
MGPRQSRTAILLGAGASADAGLPLTARLAEQIVRAANEDVRRSNWRQTDDWVRALNMVYSAMIGHQGAHGDDPLKAVNIETLISAVRLLKSRDQHEVAPFVASWNPGLLAIGRGKVSRDGGKQIVDAIGRSLTGRGFAETDIAEAVAQIAREAMQPDLKKAFEKAEEFILGQLVRLLGSPDDVEYLSPIAELAQRQEGGADVITLNYDLTLERAADDLNVPVQRGIETWRPGGPLNFDVADGTLNLIKLHGSLDWELSRDYDPGHFPLASPSIQVVESLPERPWIVVGDREKLATDGPTLALLFAAHRALDRATHLVVVGYSFSDAHVNSAIRDWLAIDASRTISVLDLRFPSDRHGQAPRDFRSVLLASYGVTRDDGALPARLLAVEGPASATLAGGIWARPAPRPDPYASHSARVVSDELKIELTLRGAPLRQVGMHAELPQEDRTSYRRRGIATSLDPHYISRARATGQHIDGVGISLEEWHTGQTIAVTADTDGKEGLVISVRASTPVGSFSFNVVIEPA